MPKFLGRVTDGKLPPQVGAALVQAIRANEGQMVRVSLDPWSRRSTSQNAFFHGPVIDYVQHKLHEAGQSFDAEEIKHFLKVKVGNLVERKQTVDGSWDTVPISTKELTTQQWEEWLEQIRAWGAERFGWNIPFPQEH